MSYLRDDKSPEGVKTRVWGLTARGDGQVSAALFGPTGIIKVLLLSMLSIIIRNTWTYELK